MYVQVLYIPVLPRGNPIQTCTRGELLSWRGGVGSPLYIPAQGVNCYSELELDVKTGGGGSSIFINAQGVNYYPERGLEVWTGGGDPYTYLYKG